MNRLGPKGLNSQRKIVQTISMSHHKGLHIIYRGHGAGNIYKKFFKKVLAPSKEHDKIILVPYATPAKKFVPRMLKKFIYLSSKVLLLFETLNFQKDINSKRYTSFKRTILPKPRFHFTVVVSRCW